ncbi:MAG TPA: ATP-dependent zinc metalloprotease FtsH [Acidimicrobiales bacterium]|nr:ATP-dependent zinc metalloprotease FtsH [Acidimicrobiales bacterium]
MSKGPVRATKPQLPPPPPPDPGWRVEGPRSGGRGSGKPRSTRMNWMRFLTLVGIVLLINWLVASAFVNGPDDRLRIPYSEFRNQVVDGNVTKVSSRAESIQGDFRSEVTNEGKTGTKFATERPTLASEDDLFELLESKDVIISADPPDDGPSFIESVLFGFGPAILIVLLFIFLMRRAGGGVGGLSSIGRSKAKRYDASQTRTTFEDVAGIEDAEQELVEIVDFLKNPDKYRRLGAAIPKGVLLSGPPGTGKTLLARAVAGEANVPFFSLSASEFVEMIVGVGASRVRDLFQQAKLASPAIIFIDELDAIGRARGSSSGLGGHDEREQTLNQILTEMDGFTGNEGVIVLAATNRPEILDSALLRPGRFDRRVVVSPPDQVGRQQILQVHTRSVPLDDGVDLSALASTTAGMVGADLKNLVNEAALLAARREHDRVTMADFTDALEKIILGTERRLVLSQDERERTAYHESGHALLGMLQPGADPVRKISIVPRGAALGVTFQSPESDRYSYEKKYLRGRIIGMLGGRAAEELVYDEVTTGAANDLERVSQIARQMVGRWGMSDVIGPVSVLPSSGSDMPWMESSDGPSAATRELVDQEVRRIVDDCYADALRVLSENRNKLDALAQALLIRETLDEIDAYRIAGVIRQPKPVLL